MTTIIRSLSSPEMKKIMGGNQSDIHTQRWQCNVPGQDPDSYACSNSQPQSLCGSTDPCIPNGSCFSEIPYCPF